MRREVRVRLSRHDVVEERPAHLTPIDVSLAAHSDGGVGSFLKKTRVRELGEIVGAEVLHQIGGELAGQIEVAFPSESFPGRLPVGAFPVRKGFQVPQAPV